MLGVSSFLVSIALSLNLRRRSHRNGIKESNNNSTADGDNTTCKSNKTTIASEASSPVLSSTTLNRSSEVKLRRQNNDSDDVKGHHFGNFHEYYTFHKSGDRCSSLPDNYFIDMWEHVGKPAEVHILDIGANEGDLTYELLVEAQKQLPGVSVRVIGVDLDDVLVQRAREKYASISQLTFSTINIMEPDSMKLLMCEQGIGSFSLVSCFSITMWIHMNHGDDGLLRFLDLAAQLTDCSVLLEPQLWKSYRNAIERCRRRRIPELPHYKDLLIKDVKRTCIDVFTRKYRMVLQQSNETPGWNRPLLLFSFKPLC